MKRYIIFLLLFFILSIQVFASGSRQYQPLSELEKNFYQRIDKSIWPDDIRKDIEKYRNSDVGWVGVIEKYMTDFNNSEYNVIGFYVKHHFYDWIENVNPQNTLINLSSKGEGYFICYYLFKKEIDPKQIVKDFTGDIIINYGSPIRVSEDGVIEMTNDYIRIIDKKYVNPNWMNYGRDGLGEIIIK